MTPEGELRPGMASTTEYVIEARDLTKVFKERRSWLGRSGDGAGHRGSALLLADLGEPTDRIFRRPLTPGERSPGGSHQGMLISAGGSRHE